MWWTVSASASLGESPAAAKRRKNFLQQFGPLSITTPIQMRRSTRMSDQPFYLTNNKLLLEACPEDDLLHPAANAGMVGDTLTETQYFGFSIPEEKIIGMGYMWHHPNLNIVTGGIMAWRGVKRMTIAAEMLDYRSFMNDGVIANDLHEFRLDNGYGVRIVEPAKSFHMTYEDAARGNAVDLHYEAVTPAVMFGDGNHLEQGMKVRGRLKLRGEEFAVDCRTVRDRSWGKLRPEAPMPGPPFSWTTGSVGEDFFFNCTMMDHVGSNPQTSGDSALTSEQALRGGWIWRDGRLSQIVAATKSVVRDAESFVPQTFVLRMTTEDGVETVAEAKLLASCPMTTWPNVMANLSLVRWNIDGQIGFGDVQDIFWNDFIVSHGREAATMA